jgi:hypothetical protein
MISYASNLALIALTALLAGTADAQNKIPDEVIPDSVGGWHANSTTIVYDRRSIFEYLDGGAEVYLAYGMQSARARRYERAGDAAIELSMFEMEQPDGAFGVFTYERQDSDAGIGQDSEYGGGILRFWQGHHFVFIQAEVETPTSREAVLSLGKLLASRLGPIAAHPDLLQALPQEQLRPLTVRYAISPLILKNLERTLSENSLGLQDRTAIVVGRFGKPGNPARILIARLPDDVSVRKGVEDYLQKQSSRGSRPMEPFQGKDGWSLAGASGNYAVLILDMSNAALARKHFNAIAIKLKEIVR